MLTTELLKQVVPIGPVGDVLDFSGSEKGIFQSEDTQRHALGRRLLTWDGKVFRYAKAGASATVAGSLVETAAVGGAVTTDQEDCAVATASAVGDKFAYATIKTTTQPKDQFAEGFFCVVGSAANGGGHMYRILTHEAGADTESVKFTLAEAVRVAITTSAVARLLGNPYKDVLTSAASGSAVGGICGLSVYPITATEFGWIQTWGLANALVEGAVAVGTLLQRATTDAGALIADNGILAFEAIATSLATIDDTDQGPVFLKIDA